MEYYKEHHKTEAALYKHADKILKRNGVYDVSKKDPGYQIRYWFGDKYKVVDNSFTLTFGTHAGNVWNGKVIKIPVGEIIVFDTDSDIGHVWFYYPKKLIGIHAWHPDECRGFYNLLTQSLRYTGPQLLEKSGLIKEIR